MEDLIKERLRERALDARDWFEIRPDPHWWPAVAVPGAIGLAYFTVPHNLFPFLLVGAVVLTVALLILGVLGGLAFVAGRAIRDVLEAKRAAQETTKRTAAPKLQRAFH
jgi:hypothetical protein